METVTLSIIASIFASTGFWAFLTQVIQRKNQKKDPQTRMLIGLGHDRICYLGERYIQQGWISKDEYENLNDYLYVPYRDLGGNGTAKKVMEAVDRLPFKKSEE